MHLFIPKSTYLTAGLYLYLYPSKLNLHPYFIYFVLYRLSSSLQRLFVEEFQYVFLKYVLLCNFHSCFDLMHKSWSRKLAPCIMQFGNHGSLEQHGFARNRFWSIDVDPPPFPTNTSSRAFIDLILKPSEEDMKIWPYR